MSFSNSTASTRGGSAPAAVPASARATARAQRSAEKPRMSSIFGCKDSIRVKNRDLSADKAFVCLSRRLTSRHDLASPPSPRPPLRARRSRRGRGCRPVRGPRRARRGPRRLCTARRASCTFDVRSGRPPLARLGPRLLQDALSDRPLESMAGRRTRVGGPSRSGLDGGGAPARLEVRKPVLDGPGGFHPVPHGGVGLPPSRIFSLERGGGPGRPPPPPPRGPGRPAPPPPS